MKKKIGIILAVVMIFGLLTGCQEKNTETDSEGKLSVVTTIFPEYDFARQVAGDNADITLLLKPGAESHSYEPSPADIVKIQTCDVFIYVGGENDVWVDDILEGIENKDMQVIRLLDCVDVVEEETLEGMEAEEEEASSEGEEAEVEYDEHVWTSPVNAMKIVDSISSTFQEVDPEHGDEYKTNGENYNNKIAAIDKQLRDVVENGNRKELIFGDRFPFRYFADEYGLECYAAFPGCSEDTEASASTIAFLIDKVKEDKVPVVLTIELSNKKIAQTIGEDTGAKVLELHSCHNVSKEDFENGLTYVDFMERNVDVLEEALK